MKLTVKTLKGSHFEIRAQNTDTIMSIKKAIEDIQGKDNYPCGQQLLIHNGKVLKDESTLAENKISEDGFLVVMVSKSKTPSSTGASSTQAAPTNTSTSNPDVMSQAPVQPLVPTNMHSGAASNVVDSSPEQIIEQIMDMGGGIWDRESVTRALHAAYNNPERAVDYLYSGIPETTEVSVPLANFTANEVDIGVNPTTEGGANPAGFVSGAPNSSPLNMFPQGTLSTGDGDGHDSPDFLRNNQQSKTPSSTGASSTQAAPTTTSTSNPDVMPQAPVQPLVPTNMHGGAASNVVVDSSLEQAIEQIMDMGGGIWDKESVTRALRAAYNNTERAGIPETTEAAVPLTNFAANEVDIGVNPTTGGGANPAGFVSGAPNSSPLNMFPQGTLFTGDGDGHDSLDFLRNNQQEGIDRQIQPGEPEGDVAAGTQPHGNSSNTEIVEEQENNTGQPMVPERAEPAESEIDEEGIDRQRQQGEPEGDAATGAQPRGELNRYIPWMVIIIPFISAGLSLINKKALGQGMHFLVLTLYRNTIATVCLLPLVLWKERGAWREIRFPVIWRIVVLAILEPICDQNFLYAGLRRIPASLSSGLGLAQPALIFILSVIFRMEQLDITRTNNRLKLVGVLLAVVGAIIMGVSPGNTIIHAPSITTTNNGSDVPFKQSLPDGLTYTVLAMFSAAGYSLMLNMTMDVFNHPFTISFLVCLIGAVINVPITVTQISKSDLHWNSVITLYMVAYLYSGIVSSVLSTCLVTTIIGRKGPVFVAAFSPFSAVFVTCFTGFVWGEPFILSRILALVTIIFAMSLLLWGKHGDPPRHPVVQEEPPQEEP